MALTLMITGDNLADCLRQAAKLAAEGVEGVPGVKQVAHTAAAEAPAVAATVKAEQPKPVSSAEAASSPAKPPAPPSIDDVRTAMSEAVKVNGGKEIVAKALHGHGAGKISELDPVHYAAVIAEIKMAL